MSTTALDEDETILSRQRYGRIDVKVAIQNNYQAFLDVTAESTDESTAMEWYEVAIALNLPMKTEPERRFAKRVISGVRDIAKDNDPPDMRLTIPVPGRGWRLMNPTEERHIELRKDWRGKMIKAFNNGNSRDEERQAKLRSTNKEVEQSEREKQSSKRSR